ncbi:MAG: acetoin utilization protein AcuC [Thermomicrobiales bacterium]
MNRQARCTTALIYGEAYHAYRFNDTHPFNPLRLRLAVDLITACGLLEDEHRLVAPRAATDAELATAHSEAYIAAVRTAGLGQLPPEWAMRYGLGTEDVPIFPQMHEAAAMLVGGSLVAAELVMASQVDHAFNIGGGLHHAGRGQASGFCVYNDIAVMCRWLVEQCGARVLYIDNDAHHGDGVQEIFYDTDQVLTVSFHETGRYLFPGTGTVEERGRGAGYGYSVNVPLDAFTDDDSWLAGFTTIVPAVARAYRPDVIVMQHGCDGHCYDPLTDLHATTRTFEGALALVHTLAHELCGGRLIVLGGGGYDPWRVAPRAWTLAWAELSGRTAPKATPAAWLARWADEAPVALPTAMRDVPECCPPIPRVREVTATNAATYERVLRTCLPLIQGVNV